LIDKSQISHEAGVEAASLADLEAVSSCAVGVIALRAEMLKANNE
jgi:hypothetical protein